MSMSSNMNKPNKKHCRCLEELSDKLEEMMQQQIFLAYNSRQEIIQRLNIKDTKSEAQAIFIYPIRMMNQIIGFLGFADCLHAKRWQVMNLSLLLRFQNHYQLRSSADFPGEPD